MSGVATTADKFRALPFWLSAVEPIGLPVPEDKVPGTLEPSH